MHINKLELYLRRLTPILVPALHIVILFTAYELLVLSGFITRIDPFLLKQWDACWYADIAEHGYRFSALQQSNTAFFPLFPYIWKLLWKLTGTGITGICIYNLSMFTAGMLILKKAFNFSWAYFLLFASVPSNMFIYVPYSEATFFFFSSLILAGLKTQRTQLLVTGLFFASLARPSAAFFIPAIILMELLHFGNRRDFVKRLLCYCAAPVTAILLIFLFQYRSTGVWLAFFKDGRSRVAHLPEFPLTTWEGLKNLWLDGLALFFGILAAVVLVVLLVRKLRSPATVHPEKALVFSLVYAAMAVITILLFGVRDAEGGSSLLSLNRFVMATPYFTVILYFLSHHIEINIRTYSVYTAVALFTLSLVNLKGTAGKEYTAVDQFFYGLLLLGSMLLFPAISLQYKQRLIAMMYLIGVFAQVLILHRFNHGMWIG